MQKHYRHDCATTRAGTEGTDGNCFAMADKLRAMRRHRDRKGSGAMHLIVYIMIISTSIYDNSKIQGETYLEPPSIRLPTL